MVEKIVAVFQAQNQADAAVGELSRAHLADLETAVYEGVSQDHPTGSDTIPTTGASGAAGPLRPTGAVPPFVPFTDLDLNVEGDDNAEFLSRMYEQGATLVVVNYHDEDEMKVTEILTKHGGRFTRED